MIGMLYMESGCPDPMCSITLFGLFVNGCHCFFTVATELFQGFCFMEWMCAGLRMAKVTLEIFLKLS